MALVLAMDDLKRSDLPVLGYLRRRLHDVSAPRTGATASQSRLLSRWGLARAEEGVWKGPGMRFQVTHDAHRLARPGRLDVSDDNHTYMFSCSSMREFKRAAGLLSHEKGTYSWLTETLRSGDVVYDIGANVGLYTILSGYHVGSRGHVYAFEPHPSNIPSLLQNVAINGLDHLTTVISVPLSDSSGYDEFVYDSLGAGDGTSGLAGARQGDGSDKRGVIKAVTSVDALVSRGLIRPPSLMKIDLKGVPAVLHGMSGVFSSDVRPRSVQVEVSDGNETAIMEFMKSQGYAAVDTHITESGQRRAKSGENHVRNVIFAT